MKVKIIYPRHVVGGKLVHPPDEPTAKTKSGPRLKYWFEAAGHNLVKNIEHADVIVNYGSIRIIDSNNQIINHPDACAGCSDKIDALMWLEFFKFGKWLPKTWVTQAHMMKDDHDGKVILKPFRGRCGNGKEILSSKHDLWGMDLRNLMKFAQEFVPISSEFRVVHVKPDYYALFRKVGGEGEIRNYQFGWRYKRQTTFEDRFPASYAKITRLARAAVELLRMDFAGVDIGLRKENSEPVFIECNAATFLRDKECKEVVKLAERRVGIH